jgi:bifunctional non-homologous end joining protein LigD
LSKVAALLRDAGHGLRLVEHIEEDRRAILGHACLLGIEGIVSKPKGSKYRSGRFDGWVKTKNRPAVNREGAEDRGKPTVRVRKLAR